MAAMTRGLVGVAVEAAHAGEPSLFKLLAWAQDSGAQAVAAAEAKLGKVGGDDEVLFREGQWCRGLLQLLPPSPQWAVSLGPESEHG